MIKELWLCSHLDSLIPLFLLIINLRFILKKIPEQNNELIEDNFV